MPLKLVTIGVYGFDEASFFAALQTAGVDTLCDMRQRRGVRGADYAFVNSKRLQRVSRNSTYAICTGKTWRRQRPCASAIKLRTAGQPQNASAPR